MLSSFGGYLSDAELAQYIDHTLIKPETTEEDVKRVCQEAIQYGDIVKSCVLALNVSPDFSSKQPVP